jgi:hypothetical protein
VKAGLGLGLCSPLPPACPSSAAPSPSPAASAPRPCGGELVVQAAPASPGRLAARRGAEAAFW